jgi:RNA polymerase sigma factor (sigma-70 family)
VANGQEFPVSETKTETTNNMDTQYLKDYKVLVSIISSEFAKRYRMIDREDISQELWLWFVQRPNKVREWYQIHEQKDRDKLIAKSLRNAALKYCTREKAKNLGYETQDNFYYEPQVIEEFLPYILTDSYIIPIGTNDINYKPGTSDVSENNTWLAVRADISTAFEAVDERHQNVLRLRFGSLSTTLKEVGEELAISEDAARKRVDRAIAAMIEELGGRKPFTDKDYSNLKENVDAP